MRARLVALRYGLHDGWRFGRSVYRAVLRFEQRSGRPVRRRELERERP